MKNIVDIILYRTGKEGSFQEIVKIGVEIHNEFMELYLGKNPDFRDIIREFNNMSCDRDKQFLKLQSMLEIYGHHIGVLYNGNN